MNKIDNCQLNSFLSNNIKPSKRIWEIDFLRGLCILLVVLDHAARLTYYYFGKVWYGNDLVGDSIGAKFCRFLFEAQTSNVRNTLRTLVLIVFFTICGLSSHLSKSNLKRACKLGLCACCISFFTHIFQTYIGIVDVYVEFGTIHFISFCIFFYILLNLITKKTPILKTGISILLFIGIIYTYHCYNAPNTTPLWMYFIFPVRTITGETAAFYYYTHVSPGDLVNLIPWSAFFLFGVAIKPILYPTNETLFPKIDRAWHKPITFVGRHSLFIYLTHLFVVGIILVIVSKIVFGTWAVF